MQIAAVILGARADVSEDQPGDSCEPAPVPAHYYRGAGQNWHQSRRHRCTLALVAGTSGDLLDYGCGYGDLTFALARTHRAEGVDVDPQRVAFAAEQYPEIRFSVCAAEGLPRPNASFDVVTSIVVIHFVPDVRGYLLEINRVLRPGGTLVLGFQNYPYLRAALRAVVGRSRGARVNPRPTEAQVRQMLAAAGFEVERCGYFYNPPLEDWRVPSDVVLGVVEQGLSLLHVRRTANYIMLRARKVAAVAPIDDVMPAQPAIAIPADRGPGIVPETA